VVKSPKLYFADLGLVRQATCRWGPLDGADFETLVVAEIHNWVATAGLNTPLHFYRTRSRLEVDVLIQTPRGIHGVEIKNRASAHSKDAIALRMVAAALGDEWLAGLVVHPGSALELFPGAFDAWAVPAHRLFQCLSRQRRNGARRLARRPLPFQRASL